MKKTVSYGKTFICLNGKEKNQNQLILFIFKILYFFYQITSCSPSVPLTLPQPVTHSYLWSPSYHPLQFCDAHRFVLPSLISLPPVLTMVFNFNYIVHFFAPLSYYSVWSSAPETNPSIHHLWFCLHLLKGIYGISQSSLSVLLFFFPLLFSSEKNMPLLLLIPASFPTSNFPSNFLYIDFVMLALGVSNSFKSSDFVFS